MEKKTLEEASIRYLQKECLRYTPQGKMMAHKAFMRGAEWHQGGIWNKPTKLPKQGKQIIVRLGSGNFTSWYASENISDVLQKLGATDWTYVEDIFPKERMKLWASQEKTTERTISRCGSCFLSRTWRTW